MPTLYRLANDVAGYNGFGLIQSDQKDSATLGASSNTTVTAPSNSVIGAPLNKTNRFLAIISASKEVWFSVNHTAAVPAGSSFASTNSELILAGEYFARVVNAGDVLNFIAPAATTDVGVVFYALAAN